MSFDYWSDASLNNELNHLKNTIEAYQDDIQRMKDNIQAMEAELERRKKKDIPKHGDVFVVGSLPTIYLIIERDGHLFYTLKGYSNPYYCCFDNNPELMSYKTNGWTKIGNIFDGTYKG